MILNPNLPCAGQNTKLRGVLHLKNVFIKLHKRRRMAAAGAAGANLLRRNFDEIFQPLTFAILMSTTTTQTRPSYGQSKFLLTSSFAVSLKHRLVS